MSDYLIIPKRDRRKYEYVWCGKCERLVNSKCGKTKKKISACKFGAQHRFRVVAYVPGSSKRFTKVFKTRDYKEFQKEAEAYVDGLANGVDSHSVSGDAYPPEPKPQPTKDRPRITFFKAVQKYLDWMQDIDVPPHKHKNLSPKYVQEVAIYFRHFGKVLESMGHNPKSLFMDAIGEREVGEFHLYLETKDENGEAKFSASAYNKGMGFMRKLYRYLNHELKFDLEDPFIGVKQKKTKRHVEMVELEEFDELMKVINEKNGKYQKLDRGKLYENNHYRPWLKDAFKLLLYTGERRDGVALLKWKDVKDSWIEIPNYKVSRITKSEVDRKAPIFKELRDLLIKLGWNKKKGLDEYIIAPDQENRTTLKNWLSKAFTHFWQLTGNPKQVSLKHLRKTYVTLMWSEYGDKTGNITGQRDDTIKEHYLNSEKLLQMASNISLRELNARTKKSGGNKSKGSMAA